MGRLSLIARYPFSLLVSPRRTKKAVPAARRALAARVGGDPPEAVDGLGVVVGAQAAAVVA